MEPIYPVNALHIGDGSSSIFRLTHLGGGLRCFLDLDERQLAIWPFANNGGVRITLKDKMRFDRILHLRGLEIIGVEEGVETPQRRFTAFWQVAPHLVDKIEAEKMPVSFWAGIRAAAREAGGTLLNEISSSVAFSLTAMERHLLSLSNEYHRELLAAFDRGTKPKDRFASIETYDLWLAIHSFLLAAGSARDYLAQALVEFVFHHDIAGAGKKKPDSMASLLKQGRKFGYLDKHAIGKVLIRASDETDSAAWLANMSEFRNIITHRAPITTLAGSSFLELASTGVIGEHRVLQIVLPLPRYPRSPNTAPLVDALVLMRYYNEKMADLAFDVGKLMPYPPKTLVLTEREIVSLEPL